MDIVMVGGSSEDEALLVQLGLALGVTITCRRIPSEPEVANARGPRALVFEALGQADLAAFAQRALRNQPAFEGVFMFVSVLADRVVHIGADSGFDDFVLHPYALEEVHGRIRALERRRAATLLEAEELDGVVIDREGREVRIGGNLVPFTAKEFALLAYLFERRGCVLSREHLLARVWGTHYDGGSRTVDVHVRRLRLKLGAALKIETVRGNGYKLGRARRSFASAHPSNSISASAAE
jgi:DNA-binding response OmpR family regulator